MKLTRQTLQPLKAEILAELAELGKKHGLAFSFAGGSFDPTGDNATLKLSIGTIQADGTVMDTARKDFELYAASFGLAPEHFGKPFKSGGRTYTITGLKPSSAKFPIMVKRDDGKGFRMPAEMVLASLASNFNPKAQ